LKATVRGADAVEDAGERLVRVPFSEQADAEAVLVHWVYDDGAVVKSGTVIAEAMFEKVTLEVTAPADGVLRRLVPKDGVFRPQDPVAEMLPPGTVVPSPPPRPPKAAVESEFVPVMPAVRRYALERGVDVAAVARRFPGQRLTRADIDAYAAEIAEGRREPSRRIPYPRERQVLIRRLTNPAAIPFTLSRRLAVPDGLRDVGIQAALAWAISAVRSEHPRLFGTLTDEGFLPAADLVLAVAIHTDRGLMAPTINGSTCRTVHDWREQLAHIAENVGMGRLDALRFATPIFALSNLGPWGIEYFTPVLLPPAVAILGLGALAGRWLPVSLTLDHRWVDGVDGARFLQDLEARLEQVSAVAD
jgi:pyruvate dehydrogenase E2 component (dihydrolipoamide acetyltransferase)